MINAIWIYNMTVETGHFDVLRRSFARVSDDQRIQAVIIAFCFGALLEALAGFGTPVAISAVMLIALGLGPMRAAAVALVANTAPVAFGALAVPITTLAEVSGLPEDQLGAMVGRQTPILALFVPMVLVGIVDGWRGVRQTLPATITCGVVFALAQFLSSNYVSVPLADIVAALLSAGAVVLVTRFWSAPQHRPDTGTDGGTEPTDRTEPVDGAGAAARADSGRTTGTLTDTRPEVLRAYAPYLIVIVVFVLAQLGPIKSALDAVTVTFDWPLLLAAANSSGGVLGKMVSPQNLAIAAGAVGLAGREGDIFRRVVGWSLLLLALMCVIVVLQATPVLSWMVP